MKMKKADVIATKAEIARRVGVSPNTVSKWAHAPDFPRRGRGGWPVEAVLTFAAAQLERAKVCQTGRDGDLKRQKLQRQIELLAVNIMRARVETESATRAEAERRGQLVSLDEHRADILELCRHFTSGLDMALQSVQGLTRDPAMFTAFQNAIGNTRNIIAARIRDAEPPPALALPAALAPPPAAVAAPPAAPSNQLPRRTTRRGRKKKRNKN